MKDKCSVPTQIGGGARQEYEITQSQLDRLLEACRPVPMIALQCGMPASPQERANDAWETLGRVMGFQHMTVEPIPSKGYRFFTAEPKCPGIDLGDGNFSGCNQSRGDCPTCGK